MPVSITANSSALIAHRSIEKTVENRTTSISKLSSGIRVFKASEDAAALAVGTSLKVDVSSLRTASVNVGQGISMLQIADGALSKINDMIIRMKELAVTGSSGQISTTERGYLDTEYQNILLEIDRLVNQTQFNSNLLLGGAPSVSLAAGTLGTSIDSDDGFVAFEFGLAVNGGDVFEVSYAAATNALTLTNATQATSQTVIVSTPGAGMIDVINFDNLDVKISLNSTFDDSINLPYLGVNEEFTAQFNLGGAAVVVADPASTGANVDSTAGFVNYRFDPGSTPGDNYEITYDSATSVMMLTNLTTTDSQSVLIQAPQVGQLRDYTFGSLGVTITLNDTFAYTTPIVAGPASQVTSMVSTSGRVEGSSFEFQLGKTTANEDRIKMILPVINTLDLGIANTSLKTKASAQNVLLLASSSLQTISTAISEIGANMNRLEFTNENIQTIIENSEAARSSLLDLDVAAEISALANTDALLEAAIGMLSRANVQPQMILKLLR